MIVDCAHYLDGSRQSDRPIPLDEAAMQCLQGGFGVALCDHVAVLV